MMSWKLEQLKYLGSPQKLKTSTISVRKSYRKEMASRSLTTLASEILSTEREGSKLLMLPFHTKSMIQTYQKFFTMKTSWAFGDIATQS